MKYLSEYQVQRFTSQCDKWWDIFYKRHSTNFFKDRQWTDREFPELFPSSQEQQHNDDQEVQKQSLLEIGCGVGNFIFPVLQKNKNIFVYACDFSKRAVDFVKSNEFYDESRCLAFVCDISSPPSASALSLLQEKQVDFVTLCFVMSAITPERMSNVVINCKSVLKPGGLVLFRDYAVNDEAQKRFMSSPDPKAVTDQLFIRQDGTLSYFFDRQELIDLFCRGVDDGSCDRGFECVECEYVHRQTTNGKENLSFGRVFLQAKFRKL